MTSGGAGNAAAPPRVIAIAALHEAAQPNVERLFQTLVKNADATYAAEPLTTGEAGVSVPASACPPSLHFKQLRAKLTVIQVPRGSSGDVVPAVAATRAADLLVLLVPGHVLLHGGTAEDLIDAQGEELVAAWKSAGMPSVVPVACGVDMRAPGKKLASARQTLNRLFDTEFGEVAGRVHNDDDVATLMRTLVHVKARAQPWRAARAYTLAQRWRWTQTGVVPTPRPLAPTESPAAHAAAALAGAGLAEPDAVQGLVALGDIPDRLAVGELAISGWVRGCALDVDSQVLVPGVGTFPLARVELAPAPFTRAQDGPTLLATAGTAPDAAGTLAPAPDLGAREQNWPSLAEEVAAEVEAAEQAAASQTYMSAWAVDDEDLANLPQEFTAKKKHLEPATAEDEHDLAALGAASVAPSMLEGNAAAQAKSLVASAQAVEEEQLEFPDEVDAPDDQAARVRFARYRGLPSFKHSPWDVKQALPISYARVFSLPNFEEACKRVQKDTAAATAAARAGALHALSSNTKPDTAGSVVSGSTAAPAVALAAQDTLEERAGEGWVAPGQYVTLVLRDVPAAALLGIAGTGLPAVGVVLLPLEGSTSVMHCTLQRLTSDAPAVEAGELDGDKRAVSEEDGDACDSDSGDDEAESGDEEDSDEEADIGSDAEAEAVVGGDADAIRGLPLPSKTPLEFVVGWRRWSVRPVFSEQVLGCDRAKFERFFHAGRWSVASAFGPICWPPAPVLAIRRDGTTGAGVLVAAGSVVDANPDRLVLKKVILTGTPVKIKRRSAVVRHMFHRPQDVRWFKTVSLWTKHGHSGTIREPLGTHGAFKALFSGILAPHDTVAMSLWKRVYPRWGESYRHVLGDAALDTSTGKLIPGMKAQGEVGTAPNALDAYMAQIAEEEEMD